MKTERIKTGDKVRATKDVWYNIVKTGHKGVVVKEFEGGGMNVHFHHLEDYNPENQVFFCRPDQLEKIQETYIVDYNMVEQYIVEVGSMWDYNGHFDNSPHRRNLKVKSIIDDMVEFEQRMPFRYSLKYFDGYSFKPMNKN